jgi:uncharacterized protein YjiK
MEQSMTIGRLIDLLSKFDRDMPIAISDDGNIYEVPEPELWDENNPEIAVVFYI